MIKILNRSFMKKICSIISCVALALFSCYGTETIGDSVVVKPVRPVMSSFMVDVGGASVLDTYLSPVRYEGVNMRLGYERMKAMKFNPEKWVKQLEVGVDYVPSENPAQTRIIHTLMLDAKWGMMHRWRDVAVSRLQLFAGGSTQLHGGALYAPANSNNVVSVKLGWDLAFSGMAVYNCKIGRMPVTFRYQATLPLVGVLYSLDYGENYYEMYVGNYAGLVHFGWPGNHFSMTNLVTADMHFGNTTLRVGYRGVTETSWVNNLNTQIFRHSFVLGIGGEWIGIKSGTDLSEKARIISAIY